MLTLAPDLRRTPFDCLVETESVGESAPRIDDVPAATARTIAVVRSRTRDRRRPPAELRKLIAALPHCRSLDDMLAAIDRAVQTTCGSPIAILAIDVGSPELRYHSAGWTSKPE